MRRQKLTEQQLVELGQRLITAASKGDCASAEEILKAGANVNFRDAKTGSTALLIACSRGRRDGNSDLVRQLLAHPRIDVNAQNSTDKTAVIIATVFAHVETVGTLLQHSTQPDLSIQDYEGMTALMHAVVIDHVQLIRMLLSTQQTTRLDVVSKTGNTVITLAKSPQVLLLLSRVQGPMMMDALSNGNIDQLQILLNQGTQVDFQDDNGDTPLILAVKCHRIDAVRVLLARGASILTTNHEKLTAVMLARQSADMLIARAILSTPLNDDERGISQRPMLSDSTQCCQCNKDFNAFARKKHCKNCGMLFCIDCVSQSAVLSCGGEPRRVCQMCFECIPIANGTASIASASDDHSENEHGTKSVANAGKTSTPSAHTSQLSIDPVDDVSSDHIVPASPASSQQFISSAAPSKSSIFQSTNVFNSSLPSPAATPTAAPQVAPTVGIAVSSNLFLHGRPAIPMDKLIKPIAAPFTSAPVSEKDSGKVLVFAPERAVPFGLSIPEVVSPKSKPIVKDRALTSPVSNSDQAASSAAADLKSPSAPAKPSPLASPVIEINGLPSLAQRLTQALRSPVAPTRTNPSTPSQSSNAATPKAFNFPSSSFSVIQNSVSSPVPQSAVQFQVPPPPQQPISPPAKQLIKTEHSISVAMELARARVADVDPVEHAAFVADQARLVSEADAYLRQDAERRYVKTDAEIESELLSRPRVPFEIVLLPHQLEKLPVVKCVFVGDAGVGKTALLQTFFGLTALNSQGIMHVQPLPPTLRVHDDFKRVMVIGGQHVMLHCWDVAGGPQYASHRSVTLHGADVVCYCYSVTDANSFAAIRQWIAECERSAPSAAKVLVACKRDERTRTPATSMSSLQINQFLARQKDMVGTASGRDLCSVTQTSSFSECSVAECVDALSKQPSDDDLRSNAQVSQIYNLFQELATAGAQSLKIKSKNCVLQ